MLETSRFLGKCFLFFSLCGGGCTGGYAVAIENNGGFEIFCHNTRAVPVNLNTVVNHVSAIVATLQGGATPAVDATATYHGGASYYLHSVGAGLAPVIRFVSPPLAPLTLVEQAQVALRRAMMGIEVYPPFHDALAVAIPLGVAAVTPLGGALVRGGYATFLAAFCYHVSHAGPASLGALLPVAMPVIGGVRPHVCVSLKLLRRASKNLKEIHWLSLPVLPNAPGMLTIKWRIDAYFAFADASAPHSATLIYYTDNSAN